MRAPEEMNGMLFLVTCAGEVPKVKRRGFAENLELQPPSATSRASLRQPYFLLNIQLIIIAYL